MKPAGVFFFLSDVFPFQKSKVYYCIYIKAELMNGPEGKVFFAYFDDYVDYPVGIISYKEYNAYLKKMKEQYSISDYTPEELNAIMENKGIFKKGMRKYSTKWFQKQYAFIERQRQIMIQSLS